MTTFLQLGVPTVQKNVLSALLICLNVVVIQMNWALYTDERKGTGGVGGRWDEG